MSEYHDPRWAPRRSPVMACGCTAYAKRLVGDDWVWVCGVHDCLDTVEPEPIPEDRMSRCTYCRETVRSADNLPFFERQPDHDHDNHYCGCRGWN